MWRPRQLKTMSTIIHNPTALDVCFPVGHISAESIRERSANRQSDLHEYGTWMGRKPLALINAILLAMHLPACDSLAQLRLHVLALLDADQTALDIRDPTGRVSQTSLFQDDPSPADSDATRINRSAPFDVHTPLPDLAAQRVARAYECTAQTLPALLAQLAVRRLGRAMVVADPMCGNGTTGVAATRLGLTVLQSDIHPMAAMQSWGILQIGGRRRDAPPTSQPHPQLYAAVRDFFQAQQIDETWHGHVIDAWLWTHDILDPESGWRVPLFESLVLHQASATVIDLIPDEATRSFAIAVRTGVSQRELAVKATQATKRHQMLYPPHHDTPSQLARLLSTQPAWQADDWQAPVGQVLMPRLVALRTLQTATQPRQWLGATDHDHAQQAQLMALLAHWWPQWRTTAIVPVADLPAITGLADWGWRSWVQLFTPRQLLTLGVLRTAIVQQAPDWSEQTRASVGLALRRWMLSNNRLAAWNANQTFAHQGLLYDRMVPAVQLVERGMANWRTDWLRTLPRLPVHPAPVHRSDVRDWAEPADLVVVDALPNHRDDSSDVPLQWVAPLIDDLPQHTVTLKPPLPADVTTLYTTILPPLVAQLSPHGRIVLLLPSRAESVLVDLVLVAWLTTLQITAIWPVTIDVSRGTHNHDEQVLVVVLAHAPPPQRCYSDELIPALTGAIRTTIADLRASDDPAHASFAEYDLVSCGMGAAMRVLTATIPADIDARRQFHDPQMPRPQQALLRHASEVAHALMIPAHVPPLLWAQLPAIDQCAVALLAGEATATAVPVRQLALTLGVKDVSVLCASQSTLLLLPGKLPSHVNEFTRSHCGALWRLLTQLAHPTHPTVDMLLRTIASPPALLFSLLTTIYTLTAPLPRWHAWHATMQILLGGLYATQRHTGGADHDA